MLNTLVNWRAVISQWLASQAVCELCLEPAGASGFLCQPCLQDLARASLACSQCAEPVLEEGRCGRCQSHPPVFDYAFCSYLYRPPLSLWIKAAKDKQQQQWLNRLMWLMQSRQPASLLQADALIPIPSSPRKRLLRGYDPAHILADQISRATGIPVLTDALCKAHTLDQRDLKAHERLRNMKKAIRPLGKDLRGKHLVLIDDVMTTGATANAAAIALKAQGAAIVGVWALARTPPG